MEISRIDQNKSISTLENATKIDNKSTKTGFSDIVEGALNKVNESQINANDTVTKFIKGEDVTMHEVMLSMQESQMSMQLLIEMRNKIVEAYQEINRVSL